MTIFRHAPAGLIASGALFITMFQAAPAHANTELMLVNHHTFKCVTIAGASPDNNVKSVQFDCDRDKSRRWMLHERPGDDIYMIRNALTGKCLTVAGDTSTANNVDVLQFSCDDDRSRRWTLKLKP